MNIKFLTSDYLIAWNILFTRSLTDVFKKSKEKLWNAYRDEYNNIYYEKDLILKDHKNYIPNNDTVYNAIMEKDEFKTIRKEAEKEKLQLVKERDDLNRHVVNLTNDIDTIKHSMTWKIGNIILALPKMVAKKIRREEKR